MIIFVNLFVFLSLAGEQWKHLWVTLPHKVVWCVLEKRDGEKSLPYLFSSKLQQFLNNSCHHGSSKSIDS